ncbi:MAG TPA: lysine--tRNA ligase [Candidatus Paceibacterota bacterium]|nr:lysine--tRNA ligase [Candidatus Paceibacterota bacterium]
MASAEEIKDVRIQKIQLLKEAGRLAYPARSSRTHTISSLIETAVAIEEAKTQVTISGRLMSLRPQGALAFGNLFDGTGKFQVLLKKNEPLDEKLFALFVETVDVGDFIECTGTVFTTNRGEKTVLVESWNMLTKSLLPLPDKWHGLQDPEEKLRKRYLDILFDPNAQEIIRTKSRFWNAARNFLLERGFIEVDTPTLEVTTGGAEANPFRTHHDDFDMDMFLRISVGELWQKRLLAGGIPRTFEIGRAYRNEGTSPEHAQEFTNLEFYSSYMEYEEGMKFTEELLKHAIKTAFGKDTFDIKGFQGIEIAGEWKKIDYTDTVKDMTGVDVLEATEEEMQKRLDELGVEYEGKNRERLTDTLWKYCRKQIAGPVWLINHPKLVSPLAKELPSDPRKVQRAQLILAGSEANNGFSELNDPIDQRERFEAQRALLEAGDTEAMMPDWEFVEMLEHGMPPAFGMGFGERLIALLLGITLRELQTFPLVKPKQEEK